MELSCHCGNVTIQVNHKPESLTSCNCSVCHRFGSLWGYYMPGEVKITSITDVAGTSLAATKSYMWGEAYIEFHHCQNCGCQTHYVTTDKVPETKYGINFRMAPVTETKEIPVRHFDGADSWKFID